LGYKNLKNLRAINGNLILPTKAMPNKKLKEGAGKNVTDEDFKKVILGFYSLVKGGPRNFRGRPLGF
jgi:hypothetical protein